MSDLTGFGIESAVKRIQNYAKITPLLTSSTLNSYFAELLNLPVENSPKLFFKCENFQKTGSFKCRGAINAVSKVLEADENIQGFVTQSAGNHGQALAFAASCFGKKCVVVAPENASKAKIDAMKHYGAEIIYVKPSIILMKKKCEKIALEENLKIIDAHDDFDVMEGQGTVALEMDEQIPDLDAVLLSVGGGGLAAGVLKYFFDKNPKVKVYLIEPEGKNITESVLAGKRLWQSGSFLDTIADGVRVRPLGENCFDIIKSCPHHVLSVNDDDIRSAWKMIHERLKIVIEPSAAMPFAAMLKHPEIFKDYKNIGLIICGGNVGFTY